MFVYFTEKDETYGSRSVAVNPDNVIAVADFKDYTSILFVNSKSIKLEDNYLDVVARLNSQN